MPKQVEIKARYMKDGEVVSEFAGSCNHCYGETLEEAMSLNAPEVINSKFIAQVTNLCRLEKYYRI